MVVSSRGLLCDEGQSFSDTARSALPSVGDPSWFAPPVDVRRDGDALTILFHFPESLPSPRAEACGSSLILRARLPARRGGWRSHHGTRVFALPFEASPHSITLSRKDEILRVQVRRLHPDQRKLPAEPEPKEQSP